MSADKSVTIVGAGLAGALMGTFVAKRGLRVDLFERRVDMRKQEISAGRSINLALSKRGLTALAAVGLQEQVAAIGIPMEGRMMHSPAGDLTFQRYGKSGEFNYSISRRDLNCVLLDEAQRLGANLHFGAKCLDVRLDEPEAVFEVAGERLTSKPSLLIGADGAFSAVRSRMQREDRFDFSQTYIAYGYKELTIPAASDGSHRILRNALHIWPRHDFMMIGLPNLDGTFTCTLFLPWEDATQSFDKLQNPDDVRSFFEAHFPDAVALLPNLEREFFENPTGSLPYISCNPYHFGEHVVLIGDAAHAVVPFYGQGMNAAFEDCLELDQLLGRHGLENTGTVVRSLTKNRKSPSDAIRDLALANFVEMRSSVADPRFLARKKLEAILESAFPETYRSLYGMVSFSTIPYDQARDIAKVSTKFLDDSESTTHEGTTFLLVMALVRKFAGLV